MKTKNTHFNFMVALVCLFFVCSNSAFATDGTGVVTVTSLGGSCLGFTAAQSNGPDNWEVGEGGSYTMTITGVTECNGDAITVFVQSSNSGNWCFNAFSTGNGTYAGNFTVPNPACFTMPISYKCGGDQPCDNSNTFNADGPSHTHSVHLRAALFDANCTKTGNDENCLSNCTFRLTQNHTDVSCYGGSNGTILIGKHQNQGVITYIWSDGATTRNRTGLTAGTYTVTATDGAGCTASKTVTIAQPSSPLSVSMSKTDVTTVGGSDGTATATASGGTPGYTYLWSNGGITSTISNLSAGTYTVTVTDSHGCTAGNSIGVNNPPGREGAYETDAVLMNLYPNPAQDRFTIELNTNEDSEMDYTVVVVNVLNQVIYSSHGKTLGGLVRKEISFDEPISDGVYSARIIIGGDKEFNTQLLIQH